MTQTSRSGMTVTSAPSDASTVTATHRPPSSAGTRPANRTRPEHGATTTSPSAPRMSSPRCVHRTPAAT
ncbi:hypothetical protein emb_1d0677 [Coriobacteriaceae bacterium EMTCatB1]|nr:hypothetical protein emb_1d0677 [Coriobacteriaceae bacterium EMTCatB1]